jgi:hypothetical protein
MAKRIVYIVDSSDDGILGVYGSARKAVQHATEYASDFGEYGLEEMETDPVTVARSGGIAWIYRTHDVHTFARVTPFEVWS